jgi:hypothetical protein
VKIHTAVFWIMTPCYGLVGCINVSKEHTASIIMAEVNHGSRVTLEAVCSSETLVPCLTKTRCHNRDDNGCKCLICDNFPLFLVLRSLRLFEPSQNSGNTQGLDSNSRHQHQFLLVPVGINPLVHSRCIQDTGNQC